MNATGYDALARQKVFAMIAEDDIKLSWDCNICKPVLTLKKSVMWNIDVFAKLGITFNSGPFNPDN